MNYLKRHKPWPDNTVDWSRRPVAVDRCIPCHRWDRRLYWTARRSTV